MNKFLSILRNSQLFSGITEKEIQEMLCCLGARQKTFSKDDFIFRAGDTTEVIGLLLDGSAFIVQEFLGKQKYFIYCNAWSNLCGNLCLYNGYSYDCRRDRCL